MRWGYLYWEGEDHLSDVNIYEHFQKVYYTKDYSKQKRLSLIKSSLYSLWEKVVNNKCKSRSEMSMTSKKQKLPVNSVVLFYFTGDIEIVIQLKDMKWWAGIILYCLLFVRQIIVDKIEVCSSLRDQTK